MTTNSDHKIYHYQFRADLPNLVLTKVNFITKVKAGSTKTGQFCVAHLMVATCRKYEKQFYAMTVLLFTDRCNT